MLLKECAKDKEKIENLADIALCMLFLGGAVICGIGATEISQGIICYGIILLLSGILMEIVQCPFCLTAEIQVSTEDNDEKI